MLVIGGAGTIGSSYIKAILQFKIRKLVVVDINENGLNDLVHDLRSSKEYKVPADFITYPVNFGDQYLKKYYTCIKVRLRLLPILHILVLGSGYETDDRLSFCSQLNLTK